MVRKNADSTLVSFFLMLDCRRGSLFGKDDELPKKELLSACCFPFYFMKLTAEEVWKGSEHVSQNKKLAGHSLKFTECMIESIPQLCLSFHLLHHYELDSNTYIQIGSIIGSILSIMYNFCVRYAYIEHDETPTNLQIAKSGLKNCIPMMNGSVFTHFPFIAKKSIA